MELCYAIEKRNLRRITISSQKGTDEISDVFAADVVEVSDEVIVEKLLLVNIVETVDSGSKNELPSRHMLQFFCSPLNLEALLVGAMFSEGIISVAADVLSIRMGEGVAAAAFVPDAPSDGHNLPVFVDVIVKPNLVSNYLLMCQHKQRQRCSFPYVLASHCAEAFFSTASPHVSFAPLHVMAILDLMQTLHLKQQLFSRTGAAHAALLFRSVNDGDIAARKVEVIACAEDFGRHNGIDKVIGQCLLQENEIPSNCGLILSSRVSFELMSKAVRAGIKLIAAVSAPSSLAIACADYWGITLCGFVRHNKINVYSHPERVLAY